MRILLGLMIVVPGATFVAQVAADTLPWEQPKFVQQPMLGTVIDGTPYFGHNEPSWARGSLFDPTGGGPGQYNGGPWMADDFADRFDREIVHVEWWGSYVENTQPDPSTLFLLEFLSDDPVGDSGLQGEDPANNFSKPFRTLQSEVVRLGAGPHPSSGDYTETLVQPGRNGEDTYKYNAHLHNPFPQERDTVYWLKIVALIDENSQVDGWGWHNRDYTIMNPFASTPPAVVPGEHSPGVIGLDQLAVWHFQDDAVAGTTLQTSIDPDTWRVLFVEEDLSSAVPQSYIDLLDGPDGISQFSKDLAFALHYVPEPSAGLLMLLGLGVSGCLVRRERDRGCNR